MTETDVRKKLEEVGVSQKNIGWIMEDFRGLVRCSRGHVNSPYPDDGRCKECSYWLPASRR